MTPEQLKASILQYAMEGKLVSQDPNDESASELLKRISTEKSELVKEGKIKKSKNLPEITEDEKPFDIPNSWEWVRLVEVTLFGNFKSVSGQEIPNKSWVLNMDDMNKNGGGFNKITIKQKNDNYKSNKYKFSKNDVLYGKLRPYLMKVEVAKGSGYTTTEVFPIKVVDQRTLIPKYLRYCMLSPSFVSKVNESSYGVKMPRVGTKFLAKMFIPLPPFAEQKRIVERLDQIIPLVDKYAEAYNRLQEIDKGIGDRLKKSLLQHAMEGKLVDQDPNDEPASELLKRISTEKSELVKEGKIKKSKKLPEISKDEKPFDIPDSWEWVRISDISNLCSAKRVHKADWKQSGVPFYRAREIVQLAKFDFVNNELYISDQLYKEYSLYGLPKAGDLMITAVGTLGQVYIVKNSDRFYYKDASVICLQNIGNLDSRFLKYVIDSEMFKSQVKSNSNGTTVSTLTMSRMNEYIIPLPPLNEQRRIVAKLSKLFKQVDILQRDLEANSK